MRAPRMTMAALALCCAGLLISCSQAPALRLGPGYEATKIGAISFDEHGLVELGSHGQLAMGGGRIVYYNNEEEEGTLGEIDKAFRVRTLAKFDDTQEELYDLIDRQPDKAFGEIAFAKVLPWATGMLVAGRTVYVQFETPHKEQRQARLVQAIKDGKVEWTWFVRGKEVSDLRDRQAFDVNRKGSEIAFVTGDGGGFSVYHREKGPVASFRFAKPERKPMPMVPPPAGGGERKRTLPAPVEPLGPAPVLTAAQWPMREIVYLRFLSDDTFLVVGKDSDGPTVVWLKSDGTVKAGLRGAQLGEDTHFAGICGRDPVIFDEREAKLRVIAPDLAIDEIAGVKLEAHGEPLVMTLDAETLIVFRGSECRGEIYNIRRK